MPDATMLLKFRHLQETQELRAALFLQVAQDLAAHGRRVNRADAERSADSGRGAPAGRPAAWPSAGCIGTALMPARLHSAGHGSPATGQGPPTAADTHVA